MVGKVLAIEATDQPEFTTAWPYRNEVIMLLNEKGHSVTLKDGTDAISDVVYQVASDPSANITMISGVGHGTPTSFLGFSRLPVFQKGHYDRAMAEGKIIHLTSCDTGDVLGPDLVQNGCVAFIGYNSLVSWSDDTTAAAWFECDAKIDLALAGGSCVAEAHAAGMKAFVEKIEDLRNGNNGPGADFLESISRCLCSPVTNSKYGDSKAKLS
jgi:hypothetical protein